MSELQAGFQVPYEVKPCQYGKGLFAKERIPAGTLIWHYVSGVNIRSFSNAQEVRAVLATMATQEERVDFMHHAYLDDGQVNDILDDGRMWNHSEHPNTGFGPEGASPLDTYAIRDIEAGEEFVDDYGLYEYPDWWLELANEYQVPLEFVRVKKPGFNIEYEIKESPGKGRGIFTKQIIPKDELVWKLVPEKNVQMVNGEANTRAVLATLSSDAEREDWLSYSYHYSGYLIHIQDDGKMFNHSTEPNVYSDQYGDCFALRNIQVGEELVENYGKYEHPKWYYDLCDEYNSPHDYYEKEIHS